MRTVLILVGAVAIGLALRHYVAPQYLQQATLYIALAAFLDRKVKS